MAWLCIVQICFCLSRCYSESFLHGNYTTVWEVEWDKFETFLKWLPPGDPIIHCVLIKNGKEFRFTSLIFLPLAILKECIFKKTSDTTGLRVFWNGNLRLHACHACCRRWYFTLNGAECSTPGAIDGVVYMEHGAKKNLHRPRHIEGVCEKIHKGTVRVGFWVGNCAGYGSADAYTGWNSVSRIYVEEVPPPQA